MGNDLSLAQRTLDRLEELAAITDEPGSLCRTFLSPAMARANLLVAGWFTRAGGECTQDGWGNLIGHWPGTETNALTLLLGSHLDTVPNAGKFDGVLGVLVALASLESLAQQGVFLPFHVDVIGFSDEEGTRFHSAYLGSKALAGLLLDDDLARSDSRGVTVREAVAGYQQVTTINLPAPRYQPKQLLGYLEVHLEQGPVLEQMRLPLGLVKAISAQTRFVYTVQGCAGHAGTTPMNLRRDALAGAAELVLAIERIGRLTPDLVATVGQLDVRPGASNVIADHARLSVDVRHPQKTFVAEACLQIASEARGIADRRGLRVAHELIQSTDGISCAPHLVRQLARAVETQQATAPHLTSGAGHDGVVLSHLTGVAMLFVRCRDGLSHHPKEQVDLPDIESAIGALTDFLRHLA